MTHSIVVVSFEYDLGSELIWHFLLRIQASSSGIDVGAIPARGHGHRYYWPLLSCFWHLLSSLLLARRFVLHELDGL